MSKKKKQGPGTAGPYNPKIKEPVFIPVKSPSGDFDWSSTTDLKSGNVNKNV